MKFILIFLLSTISCKSRINNYKLLGTKSENKEFNIGKIIEATTGNQPRVKSLKDFIEWLPEKLFNPEQYILLKETNSMCEGEDNVDLNHPRVVLFDLKIPIFIAYTGKNGGSCDNQVEIIQGVPPQQKDSKWSFEFYLIDFDDRVPLARNDSECATCHGVPKNIEIYGVSNYEPVPIWQTFVVHKAFRKFLKSTSGWPRVYGEVGQLIGDEVDSFEMFVNKSKSLWPYSRLKGQYKPVNGGLPSNFGAPKKGQKSARLPYSASFDKLDNFFYSFIGSSKVPHIPQPSYILE